MRSSIALISTKVLMALALWRYSNVAKNKYADLVCFVFVSSGNQGSFFALNPNTGEITVIRELDREDPNLPSSVEFNIRVRF